MRRTRSRQQTGRTSLALRTFLILLIGVAPLLGQGVTTPDGQPVTPVSQSGRDLNGLIGHSATGTVMPNTAIPADLELKANGATAWKTADGTHHVLLDGNVKIGIGAYGFGASRAVVRLTPSPRPGLDARQVAIYLQDVSQIGGHGPIQQSGRRLFVTAVLTGKVAIDTASMKTEPATNDALVVAADARITRYNKALATRIANLPQGDPLIEPSEFLKAWRTRQALRGEQDPTLPDAVAAALDPELLGKQPVPRDDRPPVVVGPDQPGIKPPIGPQPPIVPVRPDPPIAGGPDINPAQVDFHAGRVVYQRGNKESYVMLLGDLQVMYTDPSSGRRLNLRANKGVLFLKNETTDELAGAARSFDASQVTGVYLEDNVIVTDGDYTLRGPRIFYDLANDKAIVLEAVFYTYDVSRKVPIYVRANQLRQESRREWQAVDARLTTSEFYEPHFSIGVDRLTVKADPVPGGTKHRAEAKDITLNYGKTPIFFWPGLSGDASDVPLRSIKAGYDSDRGATVETQWDLYSMLNLEKPTGMNASLLLDGYTRRGAGVGIDSDYDVENAFGEFKGYYLFDEGEDTPNGRNEVDPTTEHRGRVLWRHRHQLPDDWEASVEFAWVSDPNFLEEWFSDEATAEKELETSLYLKKQQDDSAFTFLAKYDLLDFIPQTDVLQTRGNVGGPDLGYTTHKLPEIAYFRVGTPLWEDRLTWYSENRGSIMRLNLPRDNPRRRGLTSAESTALFGIANGTNFDTALRGAGLDQETRYRGDTRQEIQMPLSLGPLNLTPYAVGRITAYDQDFDAYSGDSDELRFWGAVGFRAGTSFARTYNGVQNEVLDLNRIRHIIEPTVNVFFAETNVNQDDLPVYDYEVESLAEGFVTKFGLSNVFQTQRGGEGRWRSVDVLRVDSEFVVVSGEQAPESPVARFFDYRPEMSLLSDHMFHEAAWQVTDTLAAIGNVNYNFDQGEVARWNAGITVDHTPRLTTYIAVRRIESVDSMILQYGVDYLLTPKWHLGFNQSFDLEEGNNRSVSVTMTRRMPRWLMIVSFDVDTVGDVQSVGVALAPEGFGGPGGVGRNPFMQQQQ